MCTVTLTPTDRGFWMVSNRDERVSRPAAEPPARVSPEGIEALYPVDPEGGGTWIGANAAGLAATLLNYHPALGVEPAQPTSRGQVVTRALRFPGVDEALADLHATDIARFKPFTLVLCDRSLRARSLCWTGEEVIELDAPLPGLFVSSGFDQTGAEIQRSEVYAERQATGALTTLDSLLAFHRDARHSDGAVNVLMDKGFVRTVSITALHVADTGITAHYFAPPSAPGLVSHLPLAANANR